MSHVSRPERLRLHYGEKAALPFTATEYSRRLTALRVTMASVDVDAVICTSMHNVAYLSGFLYCSFGRPYACVVTMTDCTVVAAGIDGGQPWRRSVADCVTYTDWSRDAFPRALVSLVGRGRRLGFEADHLNLAQRRVLEAALPDRDWVDVAPTLMAQRTLKSDEEVALIAAGARIADVGGAAMMSALAVGVPEFEVARAGTVAMEAAIAETYPASELRDTWCWFQSGPNTDGAHNPLTTRRLAAGDLLSLNAFPMISGYYTALERTAFLGEPDAASRRIWEANVRAHELGLSLIRPGTTCAAVCESINALLEAQGLLEYRAFGYGHSFGVLSHYYGREAAVELREDVDTVLEPGMVVSMEPMLTIPPGRPGAGGYREHDILVVTEAGATNLTGMPYGPEHNVVLP